MLDVFYVDAFTGTRFKGNTAAVCLVREPIEARLMQDIAAELNLSETAFVDLSKPEYALPDLRWFTPVTEVDLCGHATLASAFVLWRQRIADPAQPLTFSSQSGTLTVNKMEDELVLDFPTREPVPCELAEAPLEGIQATCMHSQRYDNIFLLRLDSETTLRTLQPDFQAIKDSGARAVIVTAAAESGDYDFVSRFFAPNAGINEDPVTGSAHCVLGPYWAGVLGKNQLRAYQASRRGGSLRLTVKGDRILIGGQAVMVMQGKIYL